MGRQRHPARGVPTPPVKPLATGGEPGRLAVLSLFLGMLVGKGMRFVAAFLLGIAGLLLTVAWQNGPQRYLDARDYAQFTAMQSGRIAESWLALEWNPAEMGELTRWRAFAKASPCVVVEYEGDWGNSRRAFCGKRLPFHSQYTLHDLKETTPGVPFAWKRDDSGFAVVELRTSAAGLEWLAAHPADDFFLREAKLKTALEDLKVELDRPVDAAVISWGEPVPAFPLLVDPARPAEALPAGFVEARRNIEPNWVLVLIPMAMGLAAWFAGTNVFFANLAPGWRMFFGALPLLLLPWWGEAFPRAIRHMHSDVGEVIADMMGDIDINAWLIASDPEQARQLDGERLAWKLTEGRYADTFGKIRFVLPKPPPADADAALAAIAAITTAQVQAMAVADQVALFERLRSDKKRDLRGAGMAFLPVAAATARDANADAGVRKAATQFLSDWTVQPIDELSPSVPGYRERLRMWKELTTVPVDVIANPAGWVVERGEKAR